MPTAIQGIYNHVLSALSPTGRAGLAMRFEAIAEPVSSHCILATRHTLAIIDQPLNLQPVTHPLA